MADADSSRLRLLKQLCNAAERQELAHARFKASDVMAAPAITVDAVQSLRDVVQLFPSNHVRHVLVTKRGRLAGIISDRDVLKALWKERGKLNIPAGDLATANPQTASPNTYVEVLASMMLGGKFSAIPVVDSDDRPLGIVSWTDLVWLLRLILLATCPDPEHLRSNLQREVRQLISAGQISEAEGNTLVPGAASA